jgi:excisionase family DNA binding protein
MPGALMQTAEVAVLVGVTPDTVRRAVREGRLIVATTTGRGIQLYRLADVEAYMRARRGRPPCRPTDGEAS